MLYITINNNIKNDYDHIFFINILSIDDLWDLPYKYFYLTFIDFIKGFIPLALSKYLKSLSLNDNLVHIIVGDLHNFIYNKLSLELRT
ncbi:hypothetical protein RhiirA1_484536 [Rhizophagus irregularis]|uniref:Uncharacterized protein n=1 Tax=Rhizophagus irregularis TaxID=588596 RepID=A0A2N0QJ79_9GLOM|nr:hypothetical protein RhiirA1_484536 [Rhizophagus irregularis]